MSKGLFIGILLSLVSLAIQATDYNPGIIFAIPTSLMDSLGSFAIPRAIDSLANLTIPDYNFTKKIGLVDVSGSFKNFKVTRAIFNSSDVTFKFQEPKNAHVIVAKGQFQIEFDIDFLIDKAHIFGKNLTITWDNFKGNADFSLKKYEEILKLVVDKLFIDFSDISKRIDFGTTFVDKVDSYIANILLAVFGDVLNIPFALGLETTINKEFKKEFTPDVHIKDLNLTLDLSIVSDPYVQDNNFMIPMNGDFYYNLSKKAYLNPPKMTLNLSSQNPQVYIHAEVFNSLIQSYLTEKLFSIRFEAWKYGLSGFDGLYFTSQVFSDIATDFKTYNQVYNLDFMFTSAQPKSTNITLNSGNGGYIQADVSANLYFILDETNTTAAGMNLQGQIFIEILPLINSLRIYISDYEIQSVSQILGHIDTTAGYNFLNAMGQYGVGYLNYALGSHYFEPIHILFMNLSNPSINIDPNYVGINFDLAFSYKNETKNCEGNKIMDEEKEIIFA